ncbi:TMEM165/GDT1 family protein [Parendozoicomonas haliclonae]|uniref:GDT1 family protein n=1 Tax=Parendozoicomonas haliclonae TaxID=1960125 RepID=A0A1X7AQ69_9GAMM|nr:TMEM165/GDT1 family protein [Parendozoicomonas haliclonae]SMA50239.1 hypothetical protein EHSB41UT_04033 [Parendozoicomonas haliclonae]
MEALALSTLMVFIAEIGDKTQLLALLLACRYRKPWAITAGIFVATILNHAASAWLGNWLAGMFSEDVLSWLVGASFIAVAVWTLIPDKMEDEDTGFHRYGAFVATVLLFFLAEIGDKTQVATVILAAQYQPLSMVILGTTLGMMLANVPVVFLGNNLADKLPLIWIRRAAAALFLVLGIYALFGH